MAEETILVVRDDSNSARAGAQWTQRFGREQGARCVEAPRAAPSALVLDIANKQQVNYLVCGLRSSDGARTPDVDDELAALMRRAPCPLWTIQPWAEHAKVHLAVASWASIRRARRAQPRTPRPRCCADPNRCRG